VDYYSIAPDGRWRCDVNHPFDPVEEFLKKLKD
jgi:hypothetical protein